MSRFQYRAANLHGVTVEGETRAASAVQALAELEKQGLQVLSITLIDSSRQHLESLSKEARDAIELQRQQAMDNVRAWSAPLLAFSQEIKSRWLSRTLQNLSSKLQNATSLEQLARDNDTAPVLPFVIKPLGAGDQPDSWLLKIAQHMEARRNQRREMAYPLLSVLLLMAILIPIAIWIVPVFQQMFTEFGLSIAAPTKIVFAVSSWVYPHAVRTLLVLSVVVVGLAAIVRWVNRSMWLPKYLPSLTSGNRSSLRAISVLAFNSAELQRLQYPLTEAIRLAAGGCNHAYYQITAEKLADELETVGGPCSMQTQRSLPPLLLGALSAGAADAHTLNSLGRLYRDREQDRSRKLAIVVSQLTILAIGCIVGLVVIALFMPLIRMVTSLA